MEAVVEAVAAAGLPPPLRVQSSPKPLEPELVQALDARGMDLDAVSFATMVSVAVTEEGYRWGASPKERTFCMGNTRTSMREGAACKAGTKIQEAVQVCRLALVPLHVTPLGQHPR